MSLFAALFACTPLGLLPAQELPHPDGWPSLELRDGMLHGDGEEPFRFPAGTRPRVTSFSIDPAGLVFVATEAGLYLGERSGGLLAPLELDLELAQPAIDSVRVDARRRVWITSGSTLAVLDPAFFWGRRTRTFEPEAGELFLVGEDGPELLIRTDQGIVRHSRDADEPVFGGLRVNGAALPSNSILHLEHDEELRLEPFGNADAQVRFALDGQHVWRALTEGGQAIPAPVPGRHRLEVIAIDRELDRSRPFTLFLEVAPPLRERHAVVLTLGLVSFAASFAFFARRGRSRLRAGMSACLLLLFVGQFLGAVSRHARGWPFVGFGMNAQLHSAGGLVQRPRLVGFDEHGVPRQVPLRAPGVAADGPWPVLRALIEGGQGAGRHYIASYNERFPDRPLSGLQARAERTLLTRDGPVTMPPLVLAHFWAASHERDEER